MVRGEGRGALRSQWLWDRNTRKERGEKKGRLNAKKKRKCGENDERKTSLLNSVALLKRLSYLERVAGIVEGRS